MRHLSWSHVCSIHHSTSQTIRAGSNHAFVPFVSKQCNSHLLFSFVYFLVLSANLIPLLAGGTLSPSSSSLSLLSWAASPPSPRAASRRLLSAGVSLTSESSFTMRRGSCGTSPCSSSTASLRFFSTAVSPCSSKSSSLGTRLLEGKVSPLERPRSGVLDRCGD